MTSPSLKAEMVKLPRSSKLPGLPKPSTAPPGPVPGTFCHSRGARSVVEAEQPARSKGAARTSAKRTYVVLSRLATRFQYPALPGLPGAFTVTLPFEARGGSWTKCAPLWMAAEPFKDRASVFALPGRTSLLSNGRTTAQQHDMRDARPSRG